MESITVCYRRMAKSDLKGLLELSQDPHFLAGYGQTTDWPTTPEQILSWYEANLLDPKTAYFSIEVGEEKQWAGFMSLTDLSETKEEAWLSIGVCPKFWGQKIATKVLGQFIQDCFASGPLKRLNLFVFATNQRALRLYTRLGFTVHSFHKTPFGEVYQLYVMNF